MAKKPEGKRKVTHGKISLHGTTYIKNTLDMLIKELRNCGHAFAPKDVKRISQCYNVLERAHAKARTRYVSPYATEEEADLPVARVPKRRKKFLGLIVDDRKKL